MNEALSLLLLKMTVSRQKLVMRMRIQCHADVAKLQIPLKIII